LHKDAKNGGVSYKMPVPGGLETMNIGSIQNVMFSGVAAFILLPVLIFGISCTGNTPSPPEADAGKSGEVLGIAFNTVQVSNLERSMEYYRMLGFTPAGNTDPEWVEDVAENRLYKTPGARSRTAKLTMATTASGQPFTLYLRESKGVEVGDRVDFPARNPSSSHMGLMVPEADALWAQLQSAGMLRPLSWEGKLIRMPGQTSGGLAYVRDPDGFNVEIIGIRPESPKAEDQTQAPASHTTLHHIGLAVLNADKSMSFFGDLLGADYPDTLPDWVSGDNYDAVVGGHGYVIRLINGAFPEAAAPQTTMSLELALYQKPDIEKIEPYRYSDVAVSCIGFQVAGLDALYAGLKDAGIETWSEGGIVQRNDRSRAVVVRDPDVGAFVELFENPQN
jgi:catechol 2,3-dioxygenase-like lactoylglutathione lyase family enzyme